MFDKKQYLVERILSKLKNYDFYDNQLENKIIEVLNNLNNVDFVASSAETFEDSTIGWLKFVDSVVKLNNDGKEINVDNIKEILSSNIKTSKVVSSNHEFNKEILTKESSKTKLERLLQIAEKSDEFVNGFDVTDLTENGLRSAGIVGSQETSLDGESLAFHTEIKTIRVPKDETIYSPYTNTTNIFQIDTNTWMDLENEQLFKVFFD